MKMNGTPARDRRHAFPGRGRQLFVRCTDEEYADIAAAAGRCGLTPTGFAAEVALSAVRGTRPPAPEPWREALAEVMTARTHRP